jgi:aryl-alcohol dehydrogenase-like predicted oxidoreductase
MSTYYTLGRSGLRVSRLALGTMTFGTEWGWGADRSVARRLFDRYLDAGGNFLDTADGYTNGTSETWLGEFVREAGVRDRVVIATKFGFNAEPGNPNAGGSGRKNILRALEGSLRRLGTDYVDLYLLHAWDRVTPVEEVMRTLDDVVRSGKARYVGFSDVPAWYAARAQTLAELRGTEPLATLQLEYSLVERSIEDEFIPFAQTYDLPVMVWSPLASGLLSGKYRPSGDGGGDGQGRLDTMRDTANPVFHKFTERNWAVVAALEEVAEAAGYSMAQVALNWVANRPGVGSVIVGATKPHQLEDNLAALDIELPDELRARLDAVSAPEARFPYTFFGPEVQSGLTGGTTIGTAPPGYRPNVVVGGGTFGVAGAEDNADAAADSTT